MDKVFKENPQCSHIYLWEDLGVNNAKLKLSIIDPPQLELKQLPQHLKYAFLGENRTFPIVITLKSTLEQQDKLLRIPRAHQTAMGWILVDLK